MKDRKEEYIERLKEIAEHQFILTGIPQFVVLPECEDLTYALIITTEAVLKSLPAIFSKNSNIIVFSSTLDGQVSLEYILENGLN